MSQVTIEVNGRPYVVGCEDGQERRLTELAAQLDAQVRQVAMDVGPLGETRLILMGALVWVGFVATIMVPSIFYERKPPMLVVINGAYQLVGLVVMGAILGWWR